MPTITKASEMDGLWVASTYDAKVRKIELYEGRSQNKGRTLLSRLYPGHQALAQYSNSFWDIFVMTGDLEVNGERLATREHFLCYPYQDVQYRTETGCELLIFIRTNHFWSSQNPKRSQIIRISDWSWIVSKNDSKAEKVDLYDGRDGGRSIVSRRSQ